MTSSIYLKERHKSFVQNQSYNFCDVCRFNGYPNEKVVIVIEGFRCENEDGFAIKFTEYDFPIQNGKVHVHKYNDELIGKIVNQSLASVEARL